MLYYSDEFIDKQISNFINGYSTRFEPIRLPPSDDIAGNSYMVFSGRFDENIHEDRAMTWTDLFYIIAVEVTKDRSVMWSRYPIENMYSMEYPLVRVLSTTKTKKMEVDGKVYPWYPVVEVGKDSSASFVNTAIPCNVNIQSLKADYDGDSTPFRSLFTTEANMDAAKFRRDKKNFLNLQGQNIRLSERDFIQLVYSLTKPPKVVALENPN